MTQRELFLRALAKDENDTFVRLVYADWLEENGEYEEAERQRKWPAAKQWFDDACQKLNAEPYRYVPFTRDHLLEFGRDLYEIEDTEIQFSVEDRGLPEGPSIMKVIGDQLTEFWQAWSVMTAMPLTENLLDKSYVEAVWVCCATEVYPERHLAGPKPERFIQAEQEAAWAQLEAELRRKGVPADEEFYRQLADLDDAERERLIRENDLNELQNELEKNDRRNRGH